MLDNLKLDRIVFIDIETVSEQRAFNQLSEDWKKLWEHKSQFIAQEEESPEELYNKAAIYAEFGKVICISIGIYRMIDDKRVFRIKSFYGRDEKELLKEFCTLLTKHFESTDYLLCAHNGKEFDFPFLARRILVNGLKLPHLLNISGRKPWEVQHLDTLQLWKFGDYKNYTSLKVLSQLFNIKSPKIDIDGSDVGRIFWEENDLDKIVKYCQGDTLTVAQLLLSFKGLPQLDEAEVEIVP